MYAQQDALNRNQNRYGTEYLLLGLIMVDGSKAAEALTNLGVDLTQIHELVESIINQGGEPSSRELGLTLQAMQSFELAVEEARSLGHSCIGTLHLLLGLLQAKDAVSADILKTIGVAPVDVRQQTVLMFNKREDNPNET